MKVLDLIKEDRWDDDEEHGDIPNPIPFEEDKMRYAFEFADEVEGELVELYKREHGISEFKSAQEYGDASKIQRNKYGVITNIAIDKLLAGEAGIYKRQVDALMKGGDVKTSSDLPIVYKMGNNYIIGDGNHRAAVAAMKGEKTLKVVLMDLDKLARKLKI